MSVRAPTTPALHFPLKDATARELHFFGFRLAATERAWQQSAGFALGFALQVLQCDK